MTDTPQTGGRERMRRWLENWKRAAPVLERATSYEFEPGVHLQTCSAEDLIIYKGAGHGISPTSKPSSAAR